MRMDAVLARFFGEALKAAGSRDPDICARSPCRSPRASGRGFLDTDTRYIHHPTPNTPTASQERQEERDRGVAGRTRPKEPADSFQCCRRRGANGRATRTENRFRHTRTWVVRRPLGWRFRRCCSPSREQGRVVLSLHPSLLAALGPSSGSWWLPSRRPCPLLPLPCLVRKREKGCVSFPPSSVCVSLPGSSSRLFTHAHTSPF